MNIETIEQMTSFLWNNLQDCKILNETREFMDKKDFINQIIFELIKEQYFDELDTDSLRNYAFKESQDFKEAREANYERKKRNNNKAITEQNKIYQQLGIITENKTKKYNINDKIQGYQYNIIQNKQLNNYSDLQIIQALSSGRMANSKKISREKFREIYFEYDQYVSRLISDAEQCAEKRISNSIDFYDLQIRMKIELTYYIALEMETYKIYTYQEKEVSYFIDGYWCPGIIRLQNRFILNQMAFMSYVFGEKKSKYNQAVESCFKLLVLKDAVGKIIKDSIHYHFSINDMAEFIRMVYNPFCIFQNNKNWTDKRIDLARKILKSLWN